MSDVEVDLRAVTLDDVEDLVRLCKEHAQYERASYSSLDKVSRLREALSSSPPQLAAWIARAEGAPVGYATATMEYSTWAAQYFLHMDCLFVREGYRSRGIGQILFEQVRRYARHRGISEIQWQTPAWNLNARRFYERQGASALEKLRFTLAVS